MNRVTKTLKIQLCSDLCVGSGFAYAGIIDSDVSYNKNGIPYISGRRIKGCMREAAKLIGISKQEISSIFGDRGNGGVVGITIGNAFPEDYQVINNTISNIKQNNEELAEYLNQQNILNLYTTIKAQTEIGKDGVAVDGSLRFIRTIQQYNPLEYGKPLVFETQITYEYTGGEDKIKAPLSVIVKATRNMGLNRNRGLGSVRLELSDEKTEKIEELKKLIENQKDEQGEKDKKYKKISYVICNEQPLLMSGSQDAVSDSYISGASVLGALAGEYLKYANIENAIFRDLFLTGDTKFSNLTLAKKMVKTKEEGNKKINSDEEWRIYYPAPLYINRLKKTKKLVNIAINSSKTQNYMEQKTQNDTEDKEYNIEGGNLPKKLKTQYIAFVDGKYDVAEVEKTIMYHHSKYGMTREGEQGLLYSLEAIEEGQYFAGDIIVEEKYCELIKKLLYIAKLRFGKSKSAQYGLCRLEDSFDEELSSSSESEKNNKVVNQNTKTVMAKKRFSQGEKVMVTLLSDSVFINEAGIYTVNYNEVKTAIANRLGITYQKDNSQSFLQTKVLTGFQTTWNLKKQDVPAIQAGSAFCYTLAEDWVINEEYVGERNIEGLGKCRVDSLSQAKYRVEELKTKDSSKTENAQEIENTKETELNSIEKIIRLILIEKLYIHMKEKAFSSGELDITSAALGRLALMLMEVENEEKADGFSRYIALLKRIYSIKTPDTQKKILNFLDKVIGKNILVKESIDELKYIKAKKDQIEIIVNKLVEKEHNQQDKQAFFDEYNLLKKYYNKEKQGEIQEEVFALWSKYLNDVLVYQKYHKE